MAERVNTLADRLHTTAIHLLRRVRGADLESGQSPARLSLLSVLVFGGPQTPGALAETEQVRPATITGLVRGLETSGLLRRAKNPEDGRGQIIHATARGRRVLEQARAARIVRMEEIVAGLTQRDRATVARACSILLDRMST